MATSKAGKASLKAWKPKTKSPKEIRPAEEPEPKVRRAGSSALTSIARDSVKTKLSATKLPSTKPTAAKAKPSKPSAARPSAKRSAPSAKSLSDRATKPSAAKGSGLRSKAPSAAKVPHVEAEEVVETEPRNLAVANGIKRYASGMPVGTLLTRDVMEEMCVLIAQGASVHRLTAQPGFPSRETFFSHCREDPWYAKRYNEALQLRGEHFADQIVDMADQALEAPTAEKVAALKLMVNTRQWVVSRLLPKKYGDKVIVQGDADNPIVTALVLGGDALAAKIKGKG